MTAPRHAKKEKSYPLTVEKNGRIGKIYLTGNGRFKTHFQYAGGYRQNSFATVQAAQEYLISEFSRVDTDAENSLALFPVHAKAKDVFELEQLLREQGGGATMREAVQFFLAHYQTKKFEPKIVEECIPAFIQDRKAANISGIQIKTLEKHLRHFRREFGKRKIHEITSLEFSNWLANKTAKDGKPWGTKTKRSVRGSIVSLSLFSRDFLHAILDIGKTEFQKVKAPQDDEKKAVEIYTPEQLKMLLETAIEMDVDLIPVLAIGCFLGLRPFEIHAEGLKRDALKWEAFNWNDGLLHVVGQKIRSKATRDIPLNCAVKAWLEPFRGQTGKIWNFTSNHEKKMGALRKKAGIESIHDGYRHSYASYRIRQLKGDLDELATEMGNSPSEIIDSYKRNVTDKQAESWFSVMPPDGYSETIKTALCRKTSLQCVETNKGIDI